MTPTGEVTEEMLKELEGLWSSIAEGDPRPLGVIHRHLPALIAEVRRLREERAAVVEYLRGHAEARQEGWERFASHMNASKTLRQDQVAYWLAAHADAIEKGVHVQVRAMNAVHSAAEAAGKGEK